MQFNKTKCCSLTICGHQDPHPHEYRVGTATLVKVNEMNDLGVQVTSNLRWTAHINSCTKKAEKQLWLVIRTLGFQAPEKAKLQSYMSMVRSIIEYGSVVWSTKFKNQLCIVEKIQRKATNYILVNPPYYSPNHINYKNRLILLHLLPTSFRREILDIIFFLKCLHGKTSYNITDYVQFSNRQAGVRTRHAELNTRLSISKPTLSSTAHFYPYRLTKIWNSLPQHLQTTLKPISESLVMKQFLVPFYRERLINHFDPNDTCTWISWCDCHRCSQ